MTVSFIRRIIEAFLITVLSAALGAAVWMGGVHLHVLAGELGPEPNGQALYLENCARCHGANLEGQPNWKALLPSGRSPAPPHDATGHTWHHSDLALFKITKLGPAAIVGNGYESDMPGFGDVLTDAEITEILDFIKSTWPERQRSFQASKN